MTIDPKYSIGIDAMDALHARWIELIETFRETASIQLRKQAGITPLKLNLFITIWLVEHIKQEDDKYARFILGKPALAG